MKKGKKKDTCPQHQCRQDRAVGACTSMANSQSLAAKDVCEREREDVSIDDIPCSNPQPALTVLVLRVERMANTVFPDEQREGALKTRQGTGSSSIGGSISNKVLLVVCHCCETFMLCCPGEHEMRVL